MDKPCAFCGSQNLHVEDHIGTIVISCADCLSVGPVTAAQSQAQAWDLWNERHRPDPMHEETSGYAALTRPTASGCGGCCSHLPHLPVDLELDDYV